MAGVRRLQWLLALFGVGLVTAHVMGLPANIAKVVPEDEELLFTSTISYCEPPQQFIVDNMDAVFHRNNGTLDFDIVAQSLPNNATLTVFADIYAYGEDFLATSIDLCKIGDGSLCPLPSYNFAGSGVYNIPDEYKEKLPGIVYKVPSLEVFGYLRLMRTGTAETLGCLQITFSNGLTTKTQRVVWATVVVIVVASALAVLCTLWTDSLSALQWRVLDILGTMHIVVMISMLTMITPAAYFDYSLNLAWTFGLIYIKSVQRSILSSREDTGSNDLQLEYGGLLEAKYSRLANLYPSLVLNAQKEPKNILSTNLLHTFLDADTDADTMLAKRKIYAPNTGPGGEMEKGGGSRKVALANEPISFSHTGIFHYAEGNDISPYSAFLTVLVNWLFVVCIALAVFGVVLVLWYLLGRRRASTYDPVSSEMEPVHDTKDLMKPTRQAFMMPLQRVKQRYPRKSPRTLARFYFQVVRPLSLRVYEAATTPLLILIFFQWAHSNSWVSQVSASVIFGVMVCIWLVTYVPIFSHVYRTRDPASLYYSCATSPWDTHSAAVRLGSPVHLYKPKYYWFVVVQLLCVIIRACFVAFPQGTDLLLRQAVGLLVLDVLLFIVLCVLRPYRDKMSMFVQCILTVFRVILWVVCIVLSTQVNIWGIPRAVLGFVLLGVSALAIVFIFFILLWDILACVFSRHQRWTTRYAESLSSAPGEANDREPSSHYKDQGNAADAAYHDANPTEAWQAPENQQHAPEVVLVPFPAQQSRHLLAHSENF
ncbi:hypothetical protein MVES1_002597 [Malassezia vespertilionis]|uniref:ML-like domain-containing protein n=1 Tax=Malassezia vespertilionis TaxID=2020962 RepID=A0A2N1JAN1_9BASI|nr:uncharacterized protein MVES1_002597 [Malassezia vespertilionis]PKI83618.1 hypothetical protein MVES_002451 [Malassezia vespertilionis]WFD07237.1 hypothetical protein MVES1_002597 [Malassezia vespertilionis]